MRKIYTVLCLLSCILPAFAGGLSKAGKYKKAVFTLTTYGADGKELGSGQGVYLDATGKAVSAYHLFVGATKAVVTEADGKQYEVGLLTGANELYDVITFRVAGLKKSLLLPTAKAEAVPGAEVQVWTENTAKNGVTATGTVRKVDRCGSEDTTAPYYTLTMTDEGGVSGSPVFNAAEELVGIYQEAAKASDRRGYVLGVAYCNTLTTNAFSATSKPFSDVHIPVSLPEELSQAESLLYLVAGVQPLDTVLYRQYLDQMVERFPSEPSGYLSRATFYSVQNNKEAAEKDMATALKVSKKTDETQYECAKIVYSHALTYPADSLTHWNFDRVIAGCDEAYAGNPQTLYRTLKGNAQYAKHDYAGAYETYRSLCDGKDATPELWFYALQSKKMAGAPVEEQLVLADSAVSGFTKPYSKEAAPYIYVRAGLRKEAKQYREAVNDYNDYEHLNYGNLSARFYYERMEAETECRMYQQAIDDVTKAVSLDTWNPEYLLEKASLELRLNLLDECLESCASFLKQWITYSDIYRVQGVALCLKGDKKSGCKAFEQARALGDDTVDALIEKYGH
jgi:tetratricopeptide (TPR) repeat protein